MERNDDLKKLSKYFRSLRKEYDEAQVFREIEEEAQAKAAEKARRHFLWWRDRKL